MADGESANLPAPIPTPLNITALAKQLGLDRRTVHRRLAKGWRPSVRATKKPRQTPRTRVPKGNDSVPKGNAKLGGQEGVPQQTPHPMPRQTPHSTAAPAPQQTPHLVPQSVPQSTPHPMPQPIVPALPKIASATLAVAALGLAAVGITVNGWFARSLGSTELAGWLFAAIGVADDVAALVLPCCAARLWRTGHRGAAVAGWVAWMLVFAFAITAGVGSPARTSPTPSWSAPVVARQRSRWRRPRSPTPRPRGIESAAGLDQTAVCAKTLYSSASAMPLRGCWHWATAGVLRPTSDDLAMVRLLLLALLPQLAGVLLLVSRASR